MGAQRGPRSRSVAGATVDDGRGREAPVMSHLFEPLELRGLTLRNRIALSPMCMYSADDVARDGRATDFHLVHLGARAAGGAGLILSEATAVEARGRISPHDLGLWNDAQIEPLARVARFVRSQGAAFGVQLAHAGRKAGTHRPFAPTRGVVARAEGGWQAVGPGTVPFRAGGPAPERLSARDLEAIVAAFAAAAERADAAGADTVEIHAAHGYLIHSFLSPLVNDRDDRYGGSFENRTRLLLEVVDAVRSAWPEDKPLLLRISASDWHEAGWTIEDSVRLAGRAREHGVDLIDCSSGGAVPDVPIPAGPNYQAPFAERVRREAGIPAGAVGRITDPAQAEALVAEGRADLVLVGRAFLRDPSWPLHAAQALGVEAPWPVQYGWTVGG